MIDYLIYGVLPLVAPMIQIGVSCYGKNNRGIQQYNNNDMNNSWLDDFTHFLYQISLKLDSQFLKENFTYSPRDFYGANCRKKYYTVLTHLFYHNNYEHLYGNVIGLVLSGYEVYLYGGNELVHIIFLLGGMGSALYNPSKVLQWRNRITSSLSPFSSSNNNYSNHNTQLSTHDGNNNNNIWTQKLNGKLTEQVNKIYNKSTLINSVSDYIAPTLNNYTIILGSSASVFALMGATTFLQMKKIIMLSYEVFFSSSNLTPNSYNNSIAWCGEAHMEKNNRKNSKHLLFRTFLPTCFNIVTILLNIKHEHTLMNKGGVGILSEVIAHGGHTDHAAHINGFVIGGSILTLFEMGKIIFDNNEKKRKKYKKLKGILLLSLTGLGVGIGIKIQKCKRQ